MNSPPTVVTQTTTDRSHRAVAPAWHTVILLLIMLGLSLAGPRSHNMPGVAAHGRARGYVTVIIMGWAMVAFIWYGVRRRGISMRDLIGGRWTRWADFLRDFGIAIGFLIVSGLVLNGLGHLLKAAPNDAIRNLLPQNRTEIVLALMMALTAGFCEEVIFRGYLQRQFAALTHATAGGILLQGIA